MASDYQVLKAKEEAKKAQEAAEKSKKAADEAKKNMEKAAVKGDPTKASVIELITGEY